MKTRSEDDSIVDAPEARQTSVVWPLHVVVWVLLPLGIVGALVLSATATIDKAARHGVPEDIQPFAVAMLEVVSLAGTLLAVWAETRKLRREAMLAIVGASAVSFFAGISAYGWFGGVASVALVGLVHLASSAWLELRTRRASVDRPKPRTMVVTSKIIRPADIQMPTSWLTTESSAISPPTEPIELPAETVPESSTEQTPTEVRSNDRPINLEKEPRTSEQPKRRTDLTPEIIEQARRILDSDPYISKPKLADELGLTKYKAAQVREMIQTEETVNA